LTYLVENAGRPTQGWQTREYGPFLDRLDSGDRWAFRLTANPVHNATPVERGTRGKRFAHVTVAQQSAWFLRHAERRGMRVLESSAGEGERDLLLHSRRTLRFARGSQTVTLTTAVFEGHAEVTDPAALRAALVGGIGPAKGYGCGLMTLATT
jgi:CRISPR system Cascade subunit CasE